MSESQDEAMVRSIAREREQCAVGVIPFVPLDRVRWLLAKVGELTAENKGLDHAGGELAATAIRLGQENERLTHCLKWVLKDVDNGDFGEETDALIRDTLAQITAENGPFRELSK